METRETEFGSTRYSFPLGKQSPNTVLRIFERDNKLSFHTLITYFGSKVLKPNSQFIISVRNNKLYFYLTNGRRMCRAITFDRVERIVVDITKDIFRQSGDNKGMAFSSLANIKKITYDFLKSQISWYPTLNRHRVKLIDMLIIGSSKIIADRYVHEGVISIPSGQIHNILRHSSTLTELSKKVFGFTSPWAMKQSANLLNGSEPIALIFKGILPVDNIKKIYEQRQETRGRISVLYWYEHIAKIRRFIKMFHQDTIMAWYKPYDDYDWCHNEAEKYLNDTASMWSMIPEEIREIPKGMTKLREIHNHIAEIHRKVRTSDFKLKVNKKALAVDGEKINDMEIVAPKTNYELIEWGTQMHNCIASYSNRDTLLLGIKVRDRLKYCIEVNNGRIWQFLAKFNTEAPREDRVVVSKLLREKGVIEEFDLEPAY